MKRLTLALTSTTIGLLLGISWNYKAEAVTFVPPSDEAPRQTTGGASRGRITFQPPSDAAPQQTTGGASRGDVNFRPPSDAAPQQTTGGASRGDVNFRPPSDAAPQQTTGGASRGEVEFQPPGQGSPNQTSGGAARGEVEFQPPGEGAPSDVSGGASRRPEPFFTPLIPPSNYGRTTAGRPSLFVYVPETNVQQAFFSLKDEAGNLHYQGFVGLSGRQGVVRFSLPSDAPELEIGQDYQWHVVLMTDDLLRPDSPRVSGWIERIDAEVEVAAQPSLELADTYGRSGIWYDALGTLAELRETNPNDPTLASEWNDFLVQVGLDEIADRPLTK
ncbi:Membrane protein related to metalloendopeptidase [Geitlerinema sp. FC II]|nr:Membrane protein related to metalloendopeptidase [Geitlerinema sp. FC II]